MVLTPEQEEERERQREDSEIEEAAYKLARAFWDVAKDADPGRRIEASGLGGKIRRQDLAKQLIVFAQIVRAQRRREPDGK